MPSKILNVVGARPNFMKIAPIMEAYGGTAIEPVLVHTGQHYDQVMSDLFFTQLGIPEPDVNLGVGSSTHARQTAAIMEAFEPVVQEHRPDAVLVVGDINSTVACGLVAVKLGVKLIHVEAGLRSFDRTMPEEINRVVTDSISDLLFCTEQAGVTNLAREGLNGDKVHLVGNVMIDTLMRNRRKAEDSTVLGDVGLSEGQYALLTLHRPSNVDDETVFARLLEALEAIQREIPIVFPVHPRTRKVLSDSRFGPRVAAMERLRLIDPVGYLDFVKLMSHARIVLTDSGGIQEETTILRVPCLTLRHNTERPVTLECGWNQLVGTDPEAILTAFKRVMDGGMKSTVQPPLWDGKAAERIVGIIADRL